MVSLPPFLEVLPLATPTATVTHLWFASIVIDNAEPIALILLGIMSAIFLLVGQRIMRVFIFIIAFSVGAVATYLVLTERVQAPELETPHRLIIIGGVGLALGIIAVCLIHIGCLVIGGYFGFLVGTLVLMINVPGFKVVELFHAVWQVYLFLAVFVVIGMVICSLKRCQRVVLVIVSAAGGGLGLTFIVDYYINVGLAEVLLVLLHLPIKRVAPSFGPLVWAILGLWAVLTAFGVSVQLKWTSDVSGKSICGHTHSEEKSQKNAAAATAAAGGGGGANGGAKARRGAVERVRSGGGVGRDVEFADIQADSDDEGGGAAA